MRMCRWAATMRKRPPAYGEAQNRVITHKSPPSGLKEGVVFWGYSGGAAGGEGLLFFAGNGLNKRVQPRGFMVGNSRTSRMEAESVSSMTRRSTPKPRPPVGAMPYSNAVTKS